MGFFDMFKRKDKRVNHEFSDEERDLSLQKRKLQAELQRQRFELETLRLQQEKLELQDQIEQFKANLEPEEDEEGDTDSVLMLLLSKVLGGNSPVVAQSVSNSERVTPPTNTQHMTDEQLQAMIDSIPSKYVKIARKMDENSLKGYIKSNMPSLDEDSIHRAILLIHGR